MKKQLIVLLGFTIFYLKVYSQSLGLNEILKRIEDKNLEVKIKDLDIKIKEESKKEVFKNFILPSISIRSEKKWENKESGVEKIEAIVPIFQGGKALDIYKKSKSELELVKTERDLTMYSQQIIAIGEWSSVLNYKKQREITEVAISVLQKKYNKLKKLHKENKMVPKSEVLKIGAVIENNKAINFENIRKERAAKEKLKKLLGYNLNEQITLEESSVVNYLKLSEEIKKIKDLKNTILGKKQSLMVELIEYDVKIARAALYPNFYIKSSHVFKKESTGKGKYGTINGERIEIGVDYTFTWGATLNSMKQSEYLLEQAKIKYDNNIKEIELNARYKLGEIESFTKQSEAQKKRVKLLNSNLKIDNLRYDNELITTFDYLNSINQLKIAEEDFYKLQKLLLLAIIEYRSLYRREVNYD